MVVGAVYRPPSVPAAATDDLHDQLLHLHSLGKSIFVLGDMNLDLLCPEKTWGETCSILQHAAIRRFKPETNRTSAD